MEKENTEVNFTIDKNLIIVKDTSQTPKEIITKLGNLLYKYGFVKESYIQAVLDREEKFPTGLQARIAGVAVPHTDTEHVINPAIAIATLEKPVVFHQMGGTPNSIVNVEVVIMLAIHNAKLVIPILRKVIFILENDKALLKIKDAKNKEEIKNAMLDHINNIVIKEN